MPQHIRGAIAALAALGVAMTSVLPGQADVPPQTPGDLVFDVSAWAVPVPDGSVGVRALGFTVSTRGSAPGGYAVCRVAAASAAGAVVVSVGVTCAADRSQTLTVTLGKGPQSATQRLDYTATPAVGRASDHRLARINGRAMRFAPCQRVPVRFNPGPAPRPAFVMPGFRYALQQVRDASGIPLRYAGMTTFVPGARQQTLRAGIAVAYVAAGRGPQRSSFPQLRPPQVLGIGGWRSEGRWLQAGYAVVKRSAATRDETTYVQTMMHEIAHAIGLDHASRGGKQVMAPAQSAPGIVWGRGDLAGLRKAGPGRAC